MKKLKLTQGQKTLLTIALHTARVFKKECKSPYHSDDVLLEYFRGKIEGVSYGLNFDLFIRVRNLSKKPVRRLLPDSTASRVEALENGGTML